MALESRSSGAVWLYIRDVRLPNCEGGDDGESGPGGDDKSRVLSHFRALVTRTRLRFVVLTVSVHCLLACMWHVARCALYSLRRPHSR